MPDEEKKESDNIRVCVRVRPFIPREVGETCCVAMPTTETVVLNWKNGQQNAFNFDKCYWSHDAQAWNDFANDYYEFANQETLQEDVGKDLITQGLSGFNSTLFAYGQTGSGKTHSVLGPPTDPGLLPRITKGLLEEIDRKEQEYRVGDKGTYRAISRVSFVEIYNEQLRDLLVDPKAPQKTLNVQARPECISVPGLTEAPVTRYEEVDELLDLGTKNRTVAATSMNATSSRSHCIFTFKVEIEETAAGDRPKVIKSWVNLVDLAGSERQKKTGAKGDVLKEGAAINKSLSTLAKVTSCLAEGKGQPPFRDSKLTLLLRDSLSGNSKTIMMAAVSPALSNIAESLSTLNFCKQVKEIKTCAVQNEMEGELKPGAPAGIPGVGGGKKKKKGKGGGSDVGVGDLKSVKKDEIVVEQGTEGNEMYIILEGTCVVEIDGQEVAELTAGSSFGEQTALGMASKRTATVRAIEDCELKVMTAQNFGSAEEKIAELRARADIADMLLAEYSGGSYSTGGGGDFDDGGGGGGGTGTAARKVAMNKMQGSVDLAVDCPYCTNLSDDPMLQGCLKYHFPRKQHTTFGQDANCSVELRGLGIKKYMCSVFNYNQERLTISPANASDHKETVTIVIKEKEKLKELFEALTDDLTIIEALEIKGNPSVPEGARLLLGEGSMQGIKTRQELTNEEKVTVPATFIFSLDNREDNDENEEGQDKPSTQKYKQMLGGLRILVDGVPLGNRTLELKHNNRLILGRSFCFRVFIPRVATGRQRKEKKEVAKPIPKFCLIKVPVKSSEMQDEMIRQMKKTLKYEQPTEAPVIAGAAGASKLKESDIKKMMMPNDIRFGGGGSATKAEDVFVQTFRTGSPADQAGVKQGDILVSINGDEKEFKKNPADKVMHEGLDFPIILLFESRELHEPELIPVQPKTGRLLNAIIKADGEEVTPNWDNIFGLEPSSLAAPTLVYEDVFTIVPGPQKIESSAAKAGEVGHLGSCRLPEKIELKEFVADNPKGAEKGLAGAVISCDLRFSGKLAQPILHLEPLGIDWSLPAPEGNWKPDMWQTCVMLLEEQHLGSLGKLEITSLKMTSKSVKKPSGIRIRKLKVYWGLTDEDGGGPDEGFITKRLDNGELKIGDGPGTRELEVTDLEMLHDLLELPNPLKPEGYWNLIEIQHGIMLNRSSKPSIDLLEELDPTEDDPVILVFKQTKEAFSTMINDLLGPKEDVVTLEMAMLEVLDRSSESDQFQEVREYVLHLSESVGSKKAASFVRRFAFVSNLVDEANEITEELRPQEQMHFAVEVLSEAFHVDPLPNISVRLWKRLRGAQLWRAHALGEAKRRIAHQKGKTPVPPPLHQVLAIYEQDDFESRVGRMREAYEYSLHSEQRPSFDRRDIDPWLPINPSLAYELFEERDQAEQKISALYRECDTLQRERKKFYEKHKGESAPKIKKLEEEHDKATQECKHLRSSREEMERKTNSIHNELALFHAENREAWRTLREERSLVPSLRDEIDEHRKAFHEAEAARKEAEKKCEDARAQVERLRKLIEKKELADRITSVAAQARPVVSMMSRNREQNHEDDTFSAWSPDIVATTAVDIRDRRTAPPPEKEEKKKVARKSLWMQEFDKGKLASIKRPSVTV